jgi:hypothetical protein
MVSTRSTTYYQVPVLPGVIDRTKNVILGHGLLDFIALSEGTLLTIQNLTFGGQLGFQPLPNCHYMSHSALAALSSRLMDPPEL